MSRFGNLEQAYILRGDNGYAAYVIVKAIPNKTPNECDGCGRMSCTGYSVYKTENFKFLPTGIWACRLDCAVNSIDAE